MGRAGFAEHRQGCFSRGFPASSRGFSRCTTISHGCTHTKSCSLTSSIHAVLGFLEPNFWPPYEWPPYKKEELHPLKRRRFDTYGTKKYCIYDYNILDNISNENSEHKNLYKKINFPHYLINLSTLLYIIPIHTKLDL